VVGLKLNTEIFYFEYEKVYKKVKREIFILTHQNKQPILKLEKEIKEILNNKIFKNHEDGVKIKQVEIMPI